MEWQTKVTVRCFTCGLQYDQALLKDRRVEICGACGSDQIKVTNTHEED